MIPSDTLIVHRSLSRVIWCLVNAGMGLFMVGGALGVIGHVTTLWDAVWIFFFGLPFVITSAVSMREFLLHKVVMIIDGEKLRDLRRGTELRWDNVASATAVLAPRAGYIGVAIKLRAAMDAKTRLKSNGLWGIIPLAGRYDLLVSTNIVKESTDDIIRAILLHVRAHGGDTSKNSDRWFRDPVPSKPFTFEEKKLAILCAAFIIAVFGLAFGMAGWHEHAVEARRTTSTDQP